MSTLTTALLVAAFQKINANDEIPLVDIDFSTLEGRTMAYDFDGKIIGYHPDLLCLDEIPYPIYPYEITRSEFTDKNGDYRFDYEFNSRNRNKKRLRKGR